MKRRIIGRLATGLLLATFAFAQGPYRFNPEHRRPLEATLHDLEYVGTRTSYTHRERDRYQNAIRHLQQFGDALHEGGFFDKGRLDQGIGDVQNVLDHNPMPPEARERLTRDLIELRRLRQHFDDRVRYAR